MKHKNSVKYAFIFLIIFTMGFSNFVFGEETKWIAVGMLHDWFTDAGCERETARTHQIADQQDGLQWPAQFRYQDCKAAKALWIGTTDYFDPFKNKTFPFKVVHVGPRVLDEENEFMPQEFKLYGRFKHPLVYVDGDPASKLDYLDFVDEEMPDLIADRMLYNVVNTAIGITEKRRIYAFSQQNHNNYFIYEYVFKNTGIIDAKGTVNKQTLKGVIFHFQYRYSPSKEPCAYGYYWLPQSYTWGHCFMNDARNEYPISLNPITWPSPNDPPRVLFGWQGLHSKATFNTIGGPNGESGGDGRLGAAQYIGVVTLHVDESTTNNENDLYQPFTTQYIQSDESFLSDNDQFNDAKMTLEYEAMAAGHPALTHAEDVGCAIPTNCNGYGDTYIYAGTKGANPGGYTSCQGFGPYTIAPDESIRIVVAEAVNGLSRKLCYEIGANWLKGTNLILPGGGTAANANEYKNAWVYTGEDSLFQTFFRAINSFENFEQTGDFGIPKAPAPPSQFLVTSGGDRVTLKWLASADEGLSQFKGYKIYRAIHVPDTTYEEIFSCEKPNLKYEYNDTAPQRGFDYYYYITAFDDGSTNDIHPGVSMESSMFYTMTNKPAYLRRPAGESLDDIRIVPNPYNVRAKDIQYGTSGPDRIMFLNIPPICTIKIYTERGDLIQTIDHDNGTGDHEWNSNTASRQVVVSGVYIVVFETPDNQKAIRKLIIIR